NRTDASIGPPDPSNGPPADDSRASEHAAQEEQHALEALYGSSRVTCSLDQLHLRLPLPDSGSDLELLLLPAKPFLSAPPAIAVRCEGLEPAANREITLALAKLAAELRQPPMAAELAQAAADSAASMLAQDAGNITQAGAPPSAAASQDQIPRLLGPGAVANNHFAQDSIQGSPQDALDDTSRSAQILEMHSANEAGLALAGPAGAAAAPCRPKAGARQHRRAGGPSNAELVEQQRQWQEASAGRALGVQRQRLPAAKARSDVIRTVHQNQVVVISGETGCGKSTQVPQFLLEDAIAQGSGSACNIICTQPRRVSAISLASRVAQERGGKVGGQVGYSVRLDTRSSSATQVLFCTTGVLLRRLLSDSNLQDVSHVVVDEVHERSADSDLLLMLLRQLLSQPGARNLRVLLMSATADAHAFADYFRATVAGAHNPRAGRDPATRVGMLTIPGFTHPVREFHLEDVLELTQFKISRGSRWARKAGINRPESRTAQSARKAQELPAWDAQPSTTQAWEDRTDLSPQTQQSLQIVDEGVINYDLIEALIACIVNLESRDGPHVFWQGHKDAATIQASSKASGSQAILVFLPGAGEIDRLARQLRSSTQLKRAAEGLGFLILPLHGSLPPDHQGRVFEPAPKGMKKVVIATNVAESSITIDDVTVVIDAGRAKESRYDAGRSMARLQEDWISQASARQRRGRAGRVQPGVCFRLFSSTTASSLETHAAPEVLRAPLAGLCLTVKAACTPTTGSSQNGSAPMGPPAKLAEMLSRLLTPPLPASVTAAVSNLMGLGALDPSTEDLTPLGQLLCQLPMDPRLGKTLLFGAMLGCCGPVLTIAAALANGRPKGGRRAASQVCRESFLSEASMEATLAGRQDLAFKLAELGFVTQDYAAGINQPQAGAARALPPATSGPDAFSGNARFIKAAICAGFFPAVLRVEHPTARFEKVQGGALERDADPAKLRFYDHTKGRVFVHPASVNFGSSRFESGWLIYTEILETAKVYVRESSMVPIYALLLFSDQVTVAHETGMIQVGHFVRFKAPARIGVLVRELRAELDRLLLQKVADPSFDLKSCKAVDVCRSLLASDGF
ncbi:hypothetical protein WJX84_000721, partial [Apatococcus fuscideae]